VEYSVRPSGMCKTIGSRKLQSLKWASGSSPAPAHHPPATPISISTTCVEAVGTV
jgi:hypothetical protein